MSDLDREAPHPPPPPAPPPAPALATVARAKRAPAYQAFPRAGGAVIDIDHDGVSIRIIYHHERQWGLIIAFGIVALALTGKVVYDAMVRGDWALSPAAIVGAVVFALLALAAAIRGRTPPLHLIANARGLRMRGGVLNETLEWRRDEILAVTAEDLEQPHTNNRRISIVVEVRDDEYVVFPVATRQEQAAIAQALQSALKLPGTAGV